MSAPQLQDRFEFEDRVYGPFTVESGQYRVVNWPNSSRSIVEYRYVCLLARFDGRVDWTANRERGPRAKKRLQAALDGLNDAAIAPWLVRLDHRDRFGGVGYDFRFFFAMANALRRCKTILCLYGGCDPAGVEALREFARDNVTHHAILELDPFGDGEPPNDNP